MKVGIVTWFHYYNYGTALQLTALSKQLTLMGLDPSVVNYIPSGKCDSIPRISIVSEYKDKLYEKTKRILMKEKKIELQGSLFEQFYAENLKFTKMCDTMAELQSLNKEMDYFVCGSDQVWSPACFDPHYYLDFVNDSMKKVAYAPSLGMSKIEDKYIEKRIKELTQDFYSLSTREESGSKIISKLVDRPVKTVLDPTLLLNGNEWESFCNDNVHKDKSYLLAYFLGNNERYWKEVYKIANKLNMQVKIIPIYQKDFSRKGCIKEPIGPKEFLGLIKNSAFVCTDSFHGTVFAINFHKRFCTFERFKNSDRMNQNSRIHHILKVLDLEAHLYGHSEIFEEIDYQIVEQRLEKYRKESKDYIASALVERRNEIGKRHVYQNNSLCCGCGACASICPKKAISIKRNEDGFYEAIVDEKECISCGKCQNVCPLQSEDEKYDICEGELYSYKDNQLEVLKKSSSGGIAYRISKMYLEKGYSIVGCIFDKESQEAKHIVVDPDRSEMLNMLQGSKYMQSNFANVLAEIRKRENPVVIIGTPCQIAGARKIFESRKNIVYIDLICHGVPSYLIYEKYQKYLNKAYKMDVKKIIPEFRYKHKGWMEKYIYVTDSIHSVCNHQDKDYYMRLFEQCSAYAKTCYECRWRTKSAADIRIGDYWGEKFSDDTTGVSMVVALTEEGEKVIAQLERLEQGRLKQEAILDYEKGQQTRNNPRPVYYEELISELKDENKEICEIVYKYIKPFEDRKKIRTIFNDIKRKIK